MQDVPRELLTTLFSETYLLHINYIKLLLHYKLEKIFF